MDASAAKTAENRLRNRERSMHGRRRWGDAMAVGWWTVKISEIQAKR